ncbi:hypothetical protein [Curtobacterium ammoniigenes]|uniref:hypothetical protein n=1 Tax=Curtobacterium ammoniigenes TaxID=395387 RepID=UPI000833690A|nr:hypothetical protein [Curtobacterium ammoniigenes]
MNRAKAGVGTSAAATMIEIGPIRQRSLDASGRVIIAHPEAITGSWNDAPDAAAIGLCAFFALILDVAQKRTDPTYGETYRFLRTDRIDGGAPGLPQRSGWGLIAPIPFDWAWIDEHAAFTPDAAALALRMPHGSASPSAIGPGVSWRSQAPTHPEPFDAIVTHQDAADPEWAAVGFRPGEPWDGTLPPRVAAGMSEIRRIEERQLRRAHRSGTFSGPWA